MSWRIFGFSLVIVCVIVLVSFGNRGPQNDVAAVEKAIASCERLLEDIHQVLHERPTPEVPSRLLGAPRTFLHPISARSSIDEILTGDVSCDLILWKQGNCRIEEGEETFVDCVRRIGAHNVGKVTPERCRESQIFRQLLAEEADSGTNSWISLKRTPQYTQQTRQSGATKPFIPPNRRPPHSYHIGPRVCKKKDSPAPGCKMFPIGFHVPRNQIATHVQRRKIFDFLPFVPRPFPISPASPSYTLGVHDEFLSNILHEHSYFAFTHRRGGWDCLRHLEIMSSGSVPYFPDLVACAKYCMPHMPKDLLSEVPKLPGLSHIGYLPSIQLNTYETDFVVLSESSNFPSAIDPRKQMNFKTVGTIDWGLFDDKKYFDLADNLLNFTQTFLTTQSLATYILEVINYEPKRVLFLTGTFYRYLIQSVVHGFYDLGIPFAVYPLDGATLQVEESWNEALNQSEPLTEEELESRRYEYRLWQGLLYGYGMRVTPSERLASESEIAQKIESGYFDLIIYPWTVHRAPGVEPLLVRDKPFWDVVSRSVPPERIVFIDTTDDVFMDPDEVLYDMCGKGFIFRRSLHEHEC